MLDNTETAILVHVNLRALDDQTDLTECKQLAVSASLKLIETVTLSRYMPDPKYFVGHGKADEIAAMVKAHHCQLLLFNHILSTGQVRSLERLCQCRVIDRTDLILDIFAARARTFEGKLQVELAQLQHLSTRLVRGWTHLERQKGGIGLRGPGETQLETDRRLLRARIKTIRARLDKVKAQRALSRQARARNAVPSVALVGYTNAGKSTLFNALTQSTVYAADQLFATLDPTLRRVVIPTVGTVILADTVGFIRHLPHDLINAFQATLEEVCQADLLLHVIDVSDPLYMDNMQAVNAVLSQMRADQIPCLNVFNKADCLSQPNEIMQENENPCTQAGQSVWICAKDGQGLDSLSLAIADMLGKRRAVRDLCLPVTQAKLRAKLYRMEAILAESIDDYGHFTLTVCLPNADFDYIMQG